MTPAARKQGEKLERIASSLGSIRVLAEECGVSTWTARAWVSGTRTPAPESQRRLNIIASECGLPPPSPEWETGVQRREPLAHLERVTDRLLVELSSDERRFGFAHVERRTVMSVLAQLRPGLVAVKVRAADGSVEYAVCDDDLHPIYASSRDLEDLQRRFPRR